MTDENPKDEARETNDNEAKPGGAVEVDDKDLDKAEGGISSYSVPTDSFSLNFSKTTAALKPGIAGAGPGAGPHVEPIPDDNKTG